MHHAKIIHIIGAAFTMTLAGVTTAAAQFLQNADFKGATTAPWTAGQNVFLGAPPTWNRFESIPVADTITVNADSVTFFSADDNASDLLERFLLQEWSAVAGFTPFKTGDVIRFKGRARATRTGRNTSDMIVRASIRTLGYINNLSFQLKGEYTAHANIGSDWTEFDLSITFPNLRDDDSLQRVAMGFEITGAYDGVALDTGTIEFQNLQGTVTSVGGPTKFLGFDILAGTPKTINTGDWMGFLAVDNAPFVYSYRLQRWLYLDDTQTNTEGVWTYIFRGATETSGWLSDLNFAQSPFVFSTGMDRWLYIDGTQNTTNGAWAYVLRDPAAASTAAPAPLR